MICYSLLLRERKEGKTTWFHTQYTLCVPSLLLLFCHDDCYRDERVIDGDFFYLCCEIHFCNIKNYEKFMQIFKSYFKKNIAKN